MRLFVAVDIPSDIKDALHKEAMRLKGRGIRASYPSKESYHITLKFLGEVEEGKVPNIVSALKGWSGSVEPFRVRIKNKGVFPGLAQPRVVWCGVELTDELAKVQSLVEESMASLGFPKEKRDFHPHITLGRLKRLSPGERGFIRSFCGEERLYGEFVVDNIVLYRSILRPEGARYAKLEIIRLGGGV